MLTDDGREVGKVKDMLLDNKTGEIRGYYVAPTPARDAGQENKQPEDLRWLPLESILSMGRHILFILPDVASGTEPARNMRFAPVASPDATSPIVQTQGAPGPSERGAPIDASTAPTEPYQPPTAYSKPEEPEPVNPADVNGP